MSGTSSSGGETTTDVSAEGSVAVQVQEGAKPSGGAIVGKSPGRLAVLRLRRDRTAMVSGSIVIFFIVVAILAPVIEWIYGQSPETFQHKLLDSTGNPLGYLGGITFTAGLDGNIHLLGVEPGTGRDVFILLVYGARTSLMIAFSAATLAVIVGILIGTIAGYTRGWVDSVLSWIIDYMLAFPFLLFAIAIIPIVNTWFEDEAGFIDVRIRITTIIIVFALFSWMGTARLVRGQVLSLREREYVEAARAAGAGAWHIMFKQILPNLWAPILITYSLAVPATVTAEAALAFLGIGVVEPTPDWGRMVNRGIRYIYDDPMYTFIPGLALLVLVLTFNLFGDSLRDALDPKSVK